MVRARDWKQLLEQVSAETDTATLQKKSADLESAIFFRFQELATSPDGNAEWNALNRACAQLFRIRVEKLNYPYDSSRFAIGFGGEAQERVDR
jgi:hypothetical protein